MYFFCQIHKIRICSATLTNTYNHQKMLGGIAGQNKSTLRNNLVVNTIIPVASEGYGAIVGNNSGTLANNYYYNCTVDNTPKATDANGRLLKESTTQTDRDEIRLGRSSGIVIVIIGGKAYKIMY